MEQNERLRELRELKEKAGQGGKPEKVQGLHEKGRMTAWERIQYLLDPESFTELDSLVVHQCKEFGMESAKALGDGVLTGYGKIDGRQVCVFAQDATILGGSIGEMSARKICKVVDMAIKVGVPIIGLIESAGIRVQEGLAGLGGLGENLFRNMMASGVVPQISGVMGPCAGPNTQSPALGDFVLMVKGNSYMFAAGPDAIEPQEKQDISCEELGGARVHCELSGVAHVLADNEADCLHTIRKLVSYLPSNNLEEPPRIQSADDASREDPELDNIVPENSSDRYDMKDIILSIVDSRDFLEIHQSWAKNIIVGFARIGGDAVGMVGSQPKILDGALDSGASAKAARFVRFCDAFNIPIVTFVDTPGLLPSAEEEHSGILRHVAKLLYAYSEATVPKVAVITRRAYGAGYLAMSSKHVRGDINYAWPSAEIAVMGPRGAVRTIYSRDVSEAVDQEAKVTELTTQYRTRHASPYSAAEKGYVDDVIVPRETRPKIIDALEALRTKRESRPPRKHGNIPL